MEHFLFEKQEPYFLTGAAGFAGVTTGAAASFFTAFFTAFFATGAAASLVAAGATFFAGA